MKYHVLWKFMVYNSDHKNPLLDPMLKQKNLVYAFTP